MELLGASVDAPADNKSFADHNGYKFVLLSDSDKSLAKALGVLGPKGYAKRWTYVIDEHGVVRAIDKEVHPLTVGTDLPKLLDSLHVPEN